MNKKKRMMAKKKKLGQLNKRWNLSLKLINHLRLLLSVIIKFCQIYKLKKIDKFQKKMNQIKIFQIFTKIILILFKNLGIIIQIKNKIIKFLNSNRNKDSNKKYYLRAKISPKTNKSMIQHPMIQEASNKLNQNKFHY